MLLSSRGFASRPLSFLSSPLGLRVVTRPITFDTVIKSEDSLGQYIEDRKKYETPNPFKNIIPIHGKKPYEESDLYNLKPNAQQARSSPKPRPPSGKRDIGTKTNKYTQYTPGYTPANLHVDKSKIVNDFIPAGKGKTEPSKNPFADMGGEQDESGFEGDEDHQFVPVPVKFLEESLERVANVAIKLKKEEISGPEASEQLLDHIKMLLQLRMSHDMAQEGMMGMEGEEDGEYGEEDGEGEIERDREDRMEEGEEEASEEVKSTEAYGSETYWNARYTKNPEPLDWYQSYNNLRPTIRRKVRPYHKIMVVGCGNSLLSEDMYNDGLKDIVNIDVSQVVLDLMKERHKDLSMTYQKSDVTNMPEFADESLDIIIDKGTYDALVHGGETDDVGHKMLQEIHRVLKKGGSFILVSHGDEEFRKPNFDLPEFGWEIDVQPLRYKETEDVFTYIYTMTKA